MIDIVGVYTPVRVQLISLGCSKNRVDSEKLLGLLSNGGIEIVSGEYDYSKSRPDVVVINTCGFIKSAKEESIDEILFAVKAKIDGYIGSIVVCGCLTERYREELSEQIPELDAIFGTYQWKEIADYILTNCGKNSALSKLKANFKTNSKTKFQPDQTSSTSDSYYINRVQTNEKHYAYMKISDGCNRRCSYCAIPLIKGRYRSVPIEILVKEGEFLAKNGVKELILIAQDTTYYGVDLYKKRMLATLIEKLSNINGIEWIRIHYSYPSAFPTDVLEQMNSNPKVCKYLDIPLQHSSTKVLKMMRRGIDYERTQKILDKIRSKVPGIAIRTTIMVGHPGEGKREFDELLKFVKLNKFDLMGAFTYCEEEGTYDAKYYPDRISQKAKDLRYNQLMQLQSEIVLESHKKRVGTIEKVIVDRVDTNYIYTRSQQESPEVDGFILIPIKLPKGKKTPPLVLQNIIGNFAEVKIEKVKGYDYIAHFV